MEFILMILLVIGIAYCESRDRHLEEVLIFCTGVLSLVIMETFK